MRNEGREREATEMRKQHQIRLRREKESKDESKREKTAAAQHKKSQLVLRVKFRSCGFDVGCEDLLEKMKSG